MKRRALLAMTVLGLAFSQFQCLLIPSDERSGERVGNLTPKVRITGGVFSSDTVGVDYRVDFRWHGWDDDGVVTAFEWAIDDTTLERAWSTTTEFGRIFAFTATTPDTRDTRFYDWHTFFIRAVDNEFARSGVDSRYFNARTIAPETRITFPKFQSQILRRPRTFNVMWEGEDLDSSRPEKLPVFYEYKLVATNLLPDMTAYRNKLLGGDNVFLDTLQVGDRTAWIRIPFTQTDLRLTELPVPQLFIFGIRAVDEAGAIEPSLDVGENFFVFEVTDEECQPIVEVKESRLGNHIFPTDGSVWTVEVPSNTPLRFEWTGDAAFCGSNPGNVNYGLDLDNPDDENVRSPNGIGGWIGWGLWKKVQTPFVFPDRDDGKVHNFYLKMRDESNGPRSERFCWVQIRVVAFPLNKSILIVDDATPPPRFVIDRFPGEGDDSAHDRLRSRIFSCANYFLQEGERIEHFNIYQNNEQAYVPQTIPLTTIAQYKLILWNSFYYGRHSSGLNRNEVGLKRLTNYVGAGGRLYIFGSEPVSSLAGDNYLDDRGADSEGICPDVQGATNPAWKTDDFIWKFLHIRNCIIGSSSATSHIDGWVGSIAVHPLYPDLDIRTEVWDPEIPNEAGIPRGGILYFQTYKASRRFTSAPDPGLDTIYVAKTFNIGGVQSPLFREPCAVRYESTAEDSALGLVQGRVFLQTFPFVFVKENQATEAACKAVTWMMTGRDE